MVFMRSPQGALSENLRKSFGFPEVTSGSPQRKPEKFYVFPEVTCPRGDLIENLMKAYGYLGVPLGNPSTETQGKAIAVLRPTQCSFKENLRKSNAFNGVDRIVSPRKRKEILWCSRGPHRVPSAKT